MSQKLENKFLKHYSRIKELIRLFMDISEKRPEHSDTSIQAYNSLPSKIKASQRQLIYETIEKLGSATCWEVRKELNLRHQSASVRITELVRMKRIFDTGERRPSDSNRKMRVYKICPLDCEKNEC